ncbi:MAG: hypothetical protein IKJ35_04555 [Clostridia bacterium]|nr:hypothetical protein [Clostridia bacterium]
MSKKTEQKQPFEYLKDGIEERTVAQWAERLKISPAQVLRQCEETISLADTSECEEKLTESRERLLEMMESFSQTLSQQVARIPKPSGIFLSAEERAPAYRVICRVLGEIETFQRALGAAIMEMLAIDSLLARCARARNEATRVLADVGAATRRVTVGDAFFSKHGILRDRLTREGERALRVSERAQLLQARVKTFHETSLSAFCSRVEVSADMAHDGESCNPIALIRMCGELGEVTQSLIRQIRGIVI